MMFTLMGYMLRSVIAHRYYTRPNDQTLAQDCAYMVHSTNCVQFLLHIAFYTIRRDDRNIDYQIY